MKTPDQRKQYNANRVARYTADPEYRERRKANHKRWREANLDYDLQKKRERYAANADRAKELARLYREANRDEVLEKQRQRYRRNREEILRKQRERRKEAPRGIKERNNALKPTGFTVELKEFAIALQGGVCAICQTDLTELPEKHVHADHCHNSNQPRGVLCGSCNLGLGRFKDDVARLHAAIAYLENPPLANATD